MIKNISSLHLLYAIDALGWLPLVKSDLYDVIPRELPLDFYDKQGDLKQQREETHLKPQKLVDCFWCWNNAPNLTSKLKNDYNSRNKNLNFVSMHLMNYNGYLKKHNATIIFLCIDDSVMTKKKLVIDWLNNRNKNLRPKE